MPHHDRQLARLLPALRHAMAHLGVEQTPTGQELGLTNARLVALEFVETTDGCTMTDLARALALPPSLATRLVDELHRRGLVARRTDDHDRRRVRLSLTKKGAKAVQATEQEIERLVSAVVEQLTTDEAEALTTGLESFLGVLHDASSGPAALAPHAHPAGVDGAAPADQPQGGRPQQSRPKGGRT